MITRQARSSCRGQPGIGLGHHHRPAGDRRSSFARDALFSHAYSEPLRAVQAGELRVNVPWISQCGPVIGVHIAAPQKAPGETSSRCCRARK